MRTILWAAIIIALNSWPGWAGSGEWTVLFENRNLTSLANPLPIGPGLLIDVAAVGPLLGIAVSPDGSGFRIQGADGRRWRWEDGSSSLVSDGDVLPLSTPGIQQGGSLFLSAETVSELGGLQLTTDAGSRQVSFGRRTFTQPEVIEGGWRSFTVPKVTTVRVNEKRSGKPPAANPPPTHDRLDVGLGVGYVQGADWGLQTTAAGKLWGGRADFWGLVTQGEKGTRLHNSHFTWTDGRRGVEAGDMYSEAWGLVRGARYSLDKERSLGVFLKTGNTQNPNGLVTYRDSINIGQNLMVRGEIGSDRSNFASAGAKAGRLELFGFHRQLPNDLGDSKGLYGSFLLARNLSLFYSTSSLADPFSGVSRSQTYGLRLPVFRRCSMTLQSTERDHGLGYSSSRSVGLSIPLAGSANLYVRYQDNSSERSVFAGQLINLQTDTSNLLTSLSLFVSPKMHLNYQLSRYSVNGQSSDREQLIANYRVSPRTSLQTISGFPNIADIDLLRLRLEHQMGNNLSLLVDYGRLAAYQSAEDILGKRGFMVMLRKKWPCWVPARGGKIEGVVSDQLGQPLGGVSVRLGKYSAVSDAQGRYQFKCVPAAAYPLSVAQESIPADYKATLQEKQLAVNDDTEARMNFSLVPLASISGRVYFDRNGNHTYDPEEGVRGVAVVAGGCATSSNQDGCFGFYNLEPGKYTIIIPIEQLDRTYRLPGANQVEVELKPGESVADVEFRLEEQKKPVIFTDVLYSQR